MPQTNDRPIVAITMGDPAGVGPEIVIKALCHDIVHECCRPLVVGDSGVLKRALKLLGVAMDLRLLSDVTQARFTPPEVELLDLHNVDWSRVQPGTVGAEAGRAATEYVIKATELALAGQVQAIATAPLNKEAMRLGGYDFIGHTEILAELTGTPRCTTMLASGPLRVVHVTRHLPLREVAAHITTEQVLETIEITAEGLRAWGMERPRLGVAALNPHGGDGGLIGDEEITAIAPAVQAAQERGIDARGPFPADSIFVRALHDEFDVVVAMYHDQGHIPIKVHGFEESVAVTLGLPIVRTSVDHGTAFDIAWQGVADPRSMVEAIKLAARLAVGKVEEVSSHKKRDP
ncbi:MAG: 4-hydroxythreonine-4-phosphate dehydrogenase PdxA [Anaerolineae bacterium]|nr:4-hydroxythreonine-4-phosphate dehydrogenase PdxA [Anaerolineae bacterium]